MRFGARPRLAERWSVRRADTAVRTPPSILVAAAPQPLWILLRCSGPDDARR